MKCIRCGHDSKRKERLGRACPVCHGAFAFEPADRDPMTDLAFQRAIERVSGGGRLRWGVEHLYYEVCRWQRRKAAGRASLVVGLVLLAAGAVSLWTWKIDPHAPGPVRALPWIALIVGALVLLSWVRRRARPTVGVEMAQFNAMWQRWQAVHGAPKGVIVRRPPPPTPPEREPDIADYSFDRAVICDRARTVDLLVANAFHFENNCAVLSVGGYPPGPFATVKAMLKRNPRLQVFVLHDATATGCRLARTLAKDPEWFAGTVPVVDVGLRPNHARPLRGLWLPALMEGVAPGHGLSGADAAWFSRYRLELAAIRPEQVLKRLYRAINRTTERGGSGDGVSYSYSSGNGDGVQVDDACFSSDADDGGGDADGFG